MYRNGDFGLRSFLLRPFLIPFRPFRSFLIPFRSAGQSLILLYFVPFFHHKKIRKKFSLFLNMSVSVKAAFFTVRKQLTHDNFWIIITEQGRGVQSVQDSILQEEGRRRTCCRVHEETCKPEGEGQQDSAWKDPRLYQSSWRAWNESRRAFCEKGWR